MRNSIRVIRHPYCSVVTSQSLTARLLTNGKKRILRFLQELIKERKELVELIVTLLFTASILLGGAYFFLSQLAQYGW